MFKEHERSLAAGVLFCACSSEAQRARRRAAKCSEEHAKLVAAGAPFCASSLKVQQLAAWQLDGPTVPFVPALIASH